MITVVGGIAVMLLSKRPVSFSRTSLAKERVSRPCRIRF